MSFHFSPCQLLCLPLPPPNLPFCLPPSIPPYSPTVLQTREGREGVREDRAAYSAW